MKSKTLQCLHMNVHIILKDFFLSLIMSSVVNEPSLVLFLQVLNIKVTTSSSLNDI